MIALESEEGTDREDEGQTHETEADADMSESDDREDEDSYALAREARLLRCPRRIDV